ncbi:hypothetical protein [Arenimonas donghaensis]|nr:hypothetical protein [Arenimonas donghaensis]
MANLRNPGRRAIRRRWLEFSASAVGVALAWIVIVGNQGPALADQAQDAVRAVLSPPAGRFEAQSAEVVERPESTGAVRLYVLVPEIDDPGS